MPLSSGSAFKRAPKSDLPAKMITSFDEIRRIAHRSQKLRQRG
jgi:hypothetical protein